MNLFKSEMRKLFYARTSYGILAAAIGISVLSSAAAPYAIHISTKLLGGLNQQALVDSYNKMSLQAKVHTIFYFPNFKMVQNTTTR